MARGKKEVPKPTPEQRARDLWNQQVFLVKRRFTDGEKRIASVQKAIEKVNGKPFIPTFEAGEMLKAMLRDAGPLPQSAVQPAPLMSSPQAAFGRS